MAVTVSGVSGTVSTGSTITITGSGFGAKTEPKPQLWADFNDGTGNPTALGVSTSWSGADSMAAQQSVVYSGGYAAGSQAGWRTTSVGANVRLLTTLAYGAKYYIHFKRYITQTPYYGLGDSSRNTKTIRVWHDSVGGTQNWLVGTQNPSPTDFSVLDAETVAQVPNVNRFNGPAIWAEQPLGSWRTEEYVFRNNSALNAADGHADIVLDNVSAGSTDGFQMDDVTLPGPNNLIVIQQTLANNSTEQWCSTGDAYFDNIYIDINSWQRAVVGNKSTYVACTALEPQIPSAWADTSITAQCNLGRFSEDDNLYMYVVDNLNAPNANGLLIRAAVQGGPSAARRTPIGVNY